MALISSDRSRFPADPWRLVEASHSPGKTGALETIFALGNGHLGIRGAHWSPADSELPGTFINGFHETWEIKHAENAFGFARTGQRILYVPDANNYSVVIDGELLSLAESVVLDYRRTVDFATGLYTTAVTWQCNSGAIVETVVRRAVGFAVRSNLALTLELTSDRMISVDITSALVNRQDQPIMDHALTDHHVADPRRSGRHSGRVLEPLEQTGSDGSLRMAWQTAESRQRVGVAVDHSFSGGVQPIDTVADQDMSTVRYVLAVPAGETMTLEKSVSYAVADAGENTDVVAAAAVELRPVAEIFADSEEYYARYWATSDIVVGGGEELQQAVRWNLFQLAQATARADVAGIPAKGVTGSGYEGHYFWDQEIYLLPYLTYTTPEAARDVLQFRHKLLPLARERATELSVDGAMFPWRTIAGLEASAYYAAGTAQFHIGAAIAFAANRYVWASGDKSFADHQVSDLLVETARMWVSLGFFGADGAFHIHGVTGPDEYTAVVNDNLYTNVMARFNLRAAAACHNARVTEEERAVWREAADRMHLPFDHTHNVYAQDNDFMTLEPWDWDTPREKYPLLLHFHPLVIYRHQVLKQADTVLAMFLQWQDFTAEEKRQAFDFYDPITTGDSTLSACVQGIMAAEVGHPLEALEHFTEAVFIDLDDTHNNTIDGVHIASAGGIWSSLVSGFAGMRDQGELLYFDPRLPADWEDLAFQLRIRGGILHVSLSHEGFVFTYDGGTPLSLKVRDTVVAVGAGASVTVPLEAEVELTPTD